MHPSALLNQNILDSLTAHVAVLDAKGVVVAVNEAWRQFGKANGASTSVVDGIGIDYLKHCESSSPSCMPQLEALAGIRAVLEGTRSRFSLEYACNSAQEQRWFRMEVLPLSNRGTGVIVAHENITNRKLAEEALKQSEENLQVLINATPDIICFKDANGRWLKANDSILDLYQLSNVDYRNKSELELADDTAPIYQEAFRNCEASDELAWNAGGISHTEETIPDITGALHVFDVQKIPLYHADGSRKGLVVFGRDITVRKAAEADRLHFERQLLQAQKLESISVLAGGIAHDFNNLLSGIFGYLDLAQSQVRGGNTQRAERSIERALGVFERARALTQQLLTFAKGGAPLRKTAALGPFLQDNARFALSGSNASCLFDLPQDLWLCDFDEHQIGQVVDNLVINAVQAMPNGGVITIMGANVRVAEGEYAPLREGDYVRISVRDTGVGIPREHLTRIFDPFFTTKEHGTGIGLATSYSIIQKHDGYIDVESEPGVGTTFHIYLPASTRSVAEIRTVVEHRHRGQGRILLMDDEDFIREIVSTMLVQMGYEVTAVRDGREALTVYSQAMGTDRPFAAIILDLTVSGGMGGKELISEIRKVDKTTPIVASSGYSEDPVMAAPAKYGFTDRIRKPYRKNELAQLMETLLSKT